MSMIIPIAARRRIELRIIAAAVPPSHGGFILEWLPRYSVFIVIIAHDNVSWDNGHTACIITQADAVKMELFIAEKTAPTIAKLQATAKPLRKKSVKPAADVTCSECQQPLAQVAACTCQSRIKNPKSKMGRNSP